MSVLATVSVALKRVNEALQQLIQPQPQIPFMFKLPEDEETFVEKGFPGDYGELSKSFKPGETVTEMKTYRAKRVCQLKAMDDNDTCYLAKLDEADQIPSDVIKVLHTTQ